VKQNKTKTFDSRNKVESICVSCITIAKVNDFIFQKHLIFFSLAYISLYSIFYFCNFKIDNYFRM